MSTHHSFDTSLAIEFGIEEAILIHHFQHWIKYNRRLKRNFCDGRWWTYQTREEIAAHFPYLSKDMIRRNIEKLVEKKVLISGNFNKTSFDRTLWYAFENEERFIGSEENSINIYERQICQIEKSDLPNPKVQVATPIPHTKTNPKTDNEKESSLTRAKEKSALPPHPPFESFYKDQFEGKIKISKEQRDKLLEKYGGMESLVDKYLEKLYRYSLQKPKKFNDYKRHDLVIEDWIDKDLAKPDNASKGQQCGFSGLSDAQSKNWKLNQELVSELKIECPHKCSGLHFFYKHYVLKDKNNPHFDISGLIDHKDFCRYLEKCFGLSILKVRFPNE